MSLDPPKSTFSGDYISASTGRWLLKFLHALQIDQDLLAHTTNRVGVSKKFYGRTFKTALKIQHMRAYNFGGSGLSLTKLYQGMWIEAGMTT